VILIERAGTIQTIADGMNATFTLDSREKMNGANVFLSNLCDRTCRRRRELTNSTPGTSGAKGSPILFSLALSTAEGTAVKRNFR